MRFHKITFENFRSFEDSTNLDEIKSFTSFVGSNNSGKSNVLEILLFLRSMANKAWSRNYQDLTFDKNDNSINIEIELELSDDERQQIIESVPLETHVLL